MGMLRKDFGVALLAFLMGAVWLWADTDALVKNESTNPLIKERKKRDYYILPYAFSSETFDVAAGVGAAAGHVLGQSQCSAAGTVLGSSNGSALGALTINNYQIPFLRRLYVDLFTMTARYGALRVYAGNNPKYPGERPGTNDSDPDNFNQVQAWETVFEMPFRFLLPIGAGKEGALHTYQLRDGLLYSGATGAKDWDPREGGRTFITLQPSYRHQFTDLDDEEVHAQTLNLSLGLEYDNRDFNVNPSHGSFQRVGVTYDPAWLAYDQSWYFCELDLRKYVSLTDYLPFRQSVVALNFWTGDTPSWESETVDGEEVITHRAPYYTGAQLGDLYHLRGYPSHRFNGKSVIYYGGEFRVIPYWNPFPSIPIVNRLDIPWWQWAVLGEAGRVADHYNLGTLHTDMKWDAGVSFRAMVENSVVRLDCVYSPETVSVVVMVGHPF